MDFPIVGQEVIGGLFAAQSLRTTVGTHRTGGDADEEALKRAGIEEDRRREGFATLVKRVTQNLRDVEALLRAQAAAKIGT